MIRLQNLWDRLVTSMGVACVVASLLLSSTGVRTVRADEAEGALMSVDPALAVAAAETETDVAPAPAAPTPAAAGTGEPQRAGTPAVEVEPGVIVLNTRGYNYGPPPSDIDPEAAKLESRTR